LQTLEERDEISTFVKSRDDDGKFAHKWLAANENPNAMILHPGG
jgi:hypothetical protein